VSNEEPLSGKAGTTKLSGLATSINGLFTGLGLRSADMPRVVHNLQGEKAYSLEWLQVENAVWPNQLPEELRQAMQDGLMEAPDNPDEHKLDTLGLTPVLGDTGAAALPLSLGLGVGKLNYFRRYSKFELPFANDVLVVDAGDIPTRGAIYLKRGRTSTGETPIRTD
jgi:hypothetical protein